MLGNALCVCQVGLYSGSYFVFTIFFAVFVPTLVALHTRMADTQIGQQLGTTYRAVTAPNGFGSYRGPPRIFHHIGCKRFFFFHVTAKDDGLVGQLM